MKIVLIGPPLIGKTTLLNEFEKLGISTFNADAFVNEIYKKDNVGYKIIKEEFGDDFITKDGVDKIKLSQEVFKNKELLLRLNEVIHQVIMDEFIEGDYVVGELPLVIFDKYSNSVFKDKVYLKPKTSEVLSNRFETTKRQINKDFIKMLFHKWDNIDDDDFKLTFEIDNTTNYSVLANKVLEFFDLKEDKSK